MRYFIILMVLVFFSVSCKDTKGEQIRAAVENQLKLYPKSTLQDLYKNFFQDYFGPGHMVSDTTSAGAYLNRELSSFDQAFGTYYEPTGYNGHFFRVNLSVIKEGLISRNAFFDAFIRSVSNMQTITLEEWKTEWKEIDSVVRAMNLSLTDYEREREEIFSLLARNEYVMHHSNQFSEEYDLHYRIIRRDIFLKEILQQLPK